MLNDYGGEGREWDLRYLKWLKTEMKISRSLSHKKPQMRDENIAYLNPPSSGVRGIMLKYGIGRRQVEQWWNMH